jgi:hypothetical protein
MNVLSVGETYDYEVTPEHPATYTLRFSSDSGSEVSQVIAVLPPEHPFSVLCVQVILMRSERQKNRAANVQQTMRAGLNAHPLQIDANFEASLSVPPG